MEIILSSKSKNVYNAPINTDNVICVLVCKTAYNPKIVKLDKIKLYFSNFHCTLKKQITTRYV